MPAVTIHSSEEVGKIEIQSYNKELTSAMAFVKDSDFNLLCESCRSLVWFISIVP